MVVQIPQSRRRSGRGPVFVEACFWIAAVGSIVATVVYSLGPAPSVLHGFPIADKVFHASAYGAITLTWLLAAVWRPGRGGGVLAGEGIPLVVGAIVLGAGIEVAQHFVSRDSQTLDAVADTVGALAGYAVWRLIRALDRSTSRA
jgi:VanZ family protein